MVLRLFRSILPSAAFFTCSASTRRIPVYRFEFTLKGSKIHARANKILYTIMSGEVKTLA